MWRPRANRSRFASGCGHQGSSRSTPPGRVRARRGQEGRANHRASRERRGRGEVSRPRRGSEGELASGQGQAQRRTRSLRERRRAVFHLQGSAAAQGPGRLRQVDRRRMRQRRTRSQPGPVCRPAVCWSKGSAPRSSDSRFHGDLQAFSCIFLLNVKQLDESDWGALNHYVHEGGGLVVAPGTPSEPASYNGPSPSQFLPAQLAEQSHTAQPQTTFGKITNVIHPLFQRVRRGSGRHARGRAGLQVLADPATRRGDTHALEIRRRLRRALSSERSRGPRPGGSCSGRRRFRAGPIAAATCGPIPTHGANFPCRVRLVVLRS